MRVLVIALLVMVAGCEAESPPPPAPTETSFELPKLDFEAVAAEREAREASRAQLQRGLQCGWRAGWMSALRDARVEAPSAFRASAVGRSLSWAGILFLAGLGGTLMLAWILPRMRRRTRPSPEPASATPPSWASYFKGLVRRFFARLGRALRVEQFDPLLAGERQRALEACREAERQLTIGHRAVEALIGTPPEGTQARPDPRPVAVAAGVDAWRAELMALRRRLEGPGSLPVELTPDRIAPRLAVTQRAARDLRLAAERAVIGQGAQGPQVPRAPAGDATWLGLERELKERPETPRDRVATAHAELPPWVRTVGLAGAGLVVLALPMLAAWMAAGAFPLFFALLFAMGGFGAVVVARVYLHRAGRLPLLPGFADHVLSWLTGLIAATLLVTFISSWMSSESGLDMGDPPPVAMPDPKLLEAPRLFPEAPTFGGAPAPTATPPTATPPTATPPTPAPAPEGLTKEDWGLDNTSERDLVQEHATHRLQAHLADRWGLRALFGVTTQWRDYWDRLPKDPLAGDDPAAVIARQARQRADRDPWAGALRRAFARTAEIADLARPGAAEDSLWARVATRVHERHPLGPRLGPIGERCGTCAWALTPTRGDGLRCEMLRVGTEQAPRVRPEMIACQHFEPKLDEHACGQCGACCHKAFHLVPVGAGEPIVSSRPDLVTRDAGPGLGAAPFYIGRPDGFCRALERPSAPYRCSIYGERPESCRDFALGGRNCLEARRRVGLSVRP